MRRNHKFFLAMRKLRSERELWLKKSFIKLLAAFILLTILGIILGGGGISAQSQPSVKSIQVNQALGVQKDNNQYFVAGKGTVIRAFLSATEEIDETRTWVDVRRDGNFVFRINPKNTTGAVSTVDYLCVNMESCGNWAAGSYTFQARINGTDSGVTNPYVFFSGTKIRVLAVAVKANYGNGVIKEISDDRWKKMGDFMKTVYPVADKNFSWTVRPTVFDASSDQFDLWKSEGDGVYNLSVALANLIPARCKTSPQSAGCYDFVVGFLKESVVQDNKKGMAGWAYPGMKSVVAVAEDDDAPGTVAHELAHQYGIGDTYDDKDTSSIRCSVNPAPDGFEGRNWDNGMQGTIKCTAGRLASTLKGVDGKTVINGAQVAASDHPYEVGGRGALPEMADFMSASGAWQNQMWITKDSYDWLFRRLVKQEPGITKVTRLVTTSSTTQRFVSFSGTLSKTDAVLLNQLKSYTDDVTLADTAGPSMVQAINAAGDVVASTAFTVQFFTVHPPRVLNVAPFEGVINFPSDTVKFRVVKDGKVLAETPVSANPPTITGVTPQTRIKLDGPYKIAWTANDPDGGNLNYTVEYNPDVTNPSSAWIILADELETSFWTENFSELPGGNNAKIRVTAYDGVLYAEAESAEFVVLLKKPQIFLDELPWGTKYELGEDILLVADAYDPQDEWLADNKLSWTSNINGMLGYGSELLARNLDAGRHTITITATNSAGLSSNATVVVQVGETSKGSCFIATAAFGSYLHPSVGTLRDFRDAYLMTNAAGQAFVHWYYRLSPPMADLIEQKAWVKAAVRVMLLPAVGFSALALQIGLFASALIMMSLLFVSLIGIKKLFHLSSKRE